jgi:hypothetical protein
MLSRSSSQICGACDQQPREDRAEKQQDAGQNQ